MISNIHILLHSLDNKNPDNGETYNKHLIGWVKDREILAIENDSLTVDLVPISVRTQGHRAIRYDLGDGTYYLVEARSGVGYDAGLPGCGVLVMLVNESSCYAVLTDV